MNPVLFTRAGEIIEQLRNPTPRNWIDVQPLIQCGCQLLEFCGTAIDVLRDRNRLERETVAEGWGQIFRPTAKKRPRAGFVHSDLRRIGNRMVEIGRTRCTNEPDQNVALFATVAGEKLSKISPRQLSAAD